MITITLPGTETIYLEHLVFDVNGTLAVDGQLIKDVRAVMQTLQKDIQIHLLTADTHGKQDEIDQQLGIKAVRIKEGDEAEQKARYINRLGSQRTAAVGQGANDRLMLKEARIGVCVISNEGTATAALLEADLLVNDIHAALQLFEKPLRITASLRA